MSKSIQISKRSTVALPGISSYKLEVEAVNAQDMSDKIFVKQRIRNFAKGELDDTFVAVCTPVQLEDFGEDSPNEGSSYYRTNRIELIGRTPEMVQEVFDSLVYEVKKLVVDLTDLEVLSDSEIYNISAIDPVTELLAAPTITRIVGADVSLRVTLNPPQIHDAPAIAYYQYSLDDGVTWTDQLPRTPATVFDIEGLQNCTTYSVKVRAVNAVGRIGEPSENTHVSTLNLPAAPVITSVTGGSRRLVIAFVAPAFSVANPVTTYEVSINGGNSWTKVAPALVPSPITVGGLTAGVSYDVLLRGISALGYGRASLPASGIPLP